MLPKKLLALMLVVLVGAFAVQTTITRQERAVMALQFESISALFQFSGVGSSITVPAPAGLVVGELMVAVGSVFGINAAVITIPAGWVKHTEDSIPGFPTGFIASKTATVADLGANFLFSQNLGGNEAWTVGIHRFSGALAVDSFTAGIVGGTSTQISLPIVTTVADNCLILRTVQARWDNLEPTSITDPGTGGSNDHIRQGFVGGPNVVGFADPFALYYTKLGFKTPPGADPQPSPKGVYNGAVGNKTTIHYAWAVSPVLAGGGTEGSSPRDKSGKIITKAEVLEARSHAIKTKAQVKTKFDPRTRR